MLLPCPNSLTPYLERGKLYYRQNQYKAAKADYKKAITISPEDPRFYVARAETNLMLDYPTAARLKIAIKR